MHKSISRSFILSFCLLLTPWASADSNQALMTLLKALQANGTISQDVYESIVAVASEKPVTAATVDVKEIVAKEVEMVTRAQPKITMKDKFEVVSADKDFRLRVGGRVQVDAATYMEDLRKHNDGTELRRARLFVQGALWRAWQYKFQYDFAGNGKIADAYIKYTGLKPWQVTVGHFKEPFSLQEKTSSKYITFTERSLPNLFSPGRNIGVMAGRSGKHWSMNAGLFSNSADGKVGTADEAAYSITGRFTYAPILDKQRHLHLGASASYRNSHSDEATRFRSRPESHVTSTHVVDTKSFNADSSVRAVGEVAYTYKRFSLQSEFYYADIDRVGTDPDVNFSGYYVEGSWFLTDDMRPYSGSKGTYGKIKPNAIVGQGGMGAWQLAVRFSSVDLNDHDITGGDAQNFSLGLNWYANNNIRISANYINILDVTGGAGDSDSTEAFQMRAQVEF